MIDTKALRELADMLDTIELSETCRPRINIVVHRASDNDVKTLLSNWSDPMTFHQDEEKTVCWYSSGLNPDTQRRLTVFPENNRKAD